MEKGRRVFGVKVRADLGPVLGLQSFQDPQAGRVLDDALCHEQRQLDVWNPLLERQQLRDIAQRGVAALSPLR
jgi:hypothetical protein